jgi:hypothetical protein
VTPPPGCLGTAGVYSNSLINAELPVTHLDIEHEQGVVRERARPRDDSADHPIHVAGTAHPDEGGQEWVVEPGCHPRSADPAPWPPSHRDPPVQGSEALEGLAARAGLPVMIANAVVYEGIDLQTRTCAIHHMDLPWKPATLQQRNGRGVRQGNTLSTIEINYYFARRSQDGLRFNLIQGKRGWMVELIESQVRAVNDPGTQMMN